MLTRRQVIHAFGGAVAVGALSGAATLLTGCADTDPGLTEDTPLPTAEEVIEELSQSGAVDVPIEAIDGRDLSDDPQQATYALRTADDRSLEFQGWVSTASVNWHNFHQGYKRHWGCDYANAIRAVNLPACTAAAREHLDENCIREEDGLLAVRLTSYSQAQSAADAILAALSVATSAEKDRHTEAWLARPEAYLLEAAIHVDTTDSTDPSGYVCGENVCLYCDGTSNPYGGSKREETDLMRTIACTFARAALADVGPIDVAGLPDSAYEDAESYGLN